MKKINAKLLSDRGFKSEKDLTDFLKNCKDENWIKELKEYYGLVNKEEVESEEEIIEDEEVESEEDTDYEDLQEEKPKDKVKEEL